MLTDLMGHLPGIEQVVQMVVLQGLANKRWLLSYLLSVYSVTATVEGLLEDDLTFGTCVDARELQPLPLSEV